MTVSTRPLRVLIADDSPDMRMLLALALAPFTGVEVVGATGNGRDAVRLAERDRPDVVLLDLAMPDMDGLEAAARIRSSLPDCRIVVVSAFRSERMERDALAAGADAYLEKAEDESALIATLDRLFPDAHLAGTASPRDVTQESEARPLLEQRYHSLLDALEEGVLVVDPDGSVVDANFAATRILAVPTSRLLGQRLPDLGITLPDLTRPRSGVEVAFRRGDGDRRRLLVSARPLRATPGAPRGELLASIVDITDVQRSEAYYRELAAALPDTVVMVCDAELRYRIVTGGGLDAARWDASEIAGRTVFEVLQEPTASRVADAFRTALAGGATTLDGLVASRAGSSWRTTFVPVRDDDGEVVAAMAVARDVTEQLRATAALRAGEDRLHAAVSTMLDPFVVLRCVREGGSIVDFEYEYANAAAERANQVPAGALVSRRLLELLPAHRTSGLFDRYVRTVESGEPLVLDGFEYEDAWGGTSERRVFDVRAVPIDDGLAYTWRDVTKRNLMVREVAAAHAATAQALARLDAVIDAAPLAIAAIDTSDRVTLWSKGAERMFGWRADEVIGRPLPIVPDDERTEFVASRGRERRGEVLEGVELNRQHRDGHRLPVGFYTAPVVDAAGDIVETVGIIVDNTDRRRADQLVADALDHARRISESRAALMAALAHDVRNPLTVIRGFALSLEERGDLISPEQQHIMLGRIAAQADGLLRLTRDLLESEHLDDIELVRTDVDVSSIVTEAVAAMPTGEHPVTVDAPPTVASVEPVRVRRIVENLVANACHHTPPGTPVEVHVGRDADGVVVSVDDAGPGVPTSRQEQIFEAFRRGETSEGSGLGLALVARFAADHGGRAWVEDRPGGGASFKVLLPSP